MTRLETQQAREARAKEWLAWRPGQELPEWATVNEHQADVRQIADTLAEDVLAGAARLVEVEEALRAHTEFVSWLLAMDDPEDALGLAERRTVTLTKIIDRAAALAAADASTGEGTAI